MSGITDLAAESAQESGSNDGDESDYEDDYERYDLDGCYFGMQHPPTAVRGTAVALRKLWDEDNPDRADVATILDDPSIVTSEESLEETVVVRSDEESDDFKVVNLADGDTKQPSDEMIDFDGNTFYGSVETDFGEQDHIALKRGGSAGRRITRVLDVMGDLGAGPVTDDDGVPSLHGGGFPEHNGGLVEWNPDDDADEYWRYARDPQLRDDVEGEDVIIMVQRLANVDPDYDGNAYWSTVFANLDDERETELAERYAEGSDKDPEDFLADLDGDTFIELQPTTDFEADDDLLRSTSYLAWNRVDLEVLNEAREAEGFDPYSPDSE